MSARAYTLDDINLLERRAIDQARISFYAYRQLINPALKWGWFHRHLAHRLQWFCEDLTIGQRPILVLTVPPQHGKSTAVIDLVSWAAGRWPQLRTIYGSYSDDLGVRANLQLQRTFDGDRYQSIFDTRIPTHNAVAISRQSLRNRDQLDYVGHTGGFVNTTVRGPVTGKSLDLGIIDDPHKNREEANSPAIRQRVWDWYTDDFRTRCSEQSGIIVIMTRWHLDDLVGRLLDSVDADRVEVVSFPALAEEDEEFRKKDEPLFPELKSRDFLLEQRATMTEASWLSLYQQRPVQRGGGMFPVERFSIIDHKPVSSSIEETVRYWDKAGTEGGSGAQTAGVLMHRLTDGRHVVSHVEAGRWSAFEREQHIKKTAELDGRGVEIWVEQEPGSGGKESAERSIAMLAGWEVYADRVRGDKETRAEPYAAQVQGGNVCLVRADWNRAFLEQHEGFPAGKLKDQVDAAAGAFAKLNKPVEKIACLW